MPLTAGARLGPFEIVAPLGAGGMGEVYRARDTRLGREVAVKVLSRHLSATPEVRARFEREAKTISALNHPHICVLHDIGREGDTDYLVMELVEGDTLAARLARGPLPPAEALRLGAQIADALDRAHRAGVVHRDLKPGNVMLTRGAAKLMDFGLARAAASGSGGAGAVTAGVLTQSPTRTQPLTAEGAIVGTFQYMAPEQLEGGEPDTRSDLWALGCVLYEMTTGRRAFEGKSQASLIAAIMHVEPEPLSRLSPLSPPALDRLVAACLAKDPADRVQSAHDVKLQLQWIADGAPTASAVAAAPAREAAARRVQSWLAFALVALAASAVTALLLVPARRGRVARVSPERYVIGMVELQRLSAPVLSPDGREVVFSVREGATSRLYRRPLSSFEMTAIPGTESGEAPFFSPDGAWIGFVTSDAIKKVPAGGGLAQVIHSGPKVGACDWGADGMIYFTPRSGGENGLTAVSRVPETGGSAEVLAVLDTVAGESDSWLPEILPDGKTVLVTVGSGSQWKIVAIRPGGTRHTVVERGFVGRWVRTGYLLYFDIDSEAILAAPFDPAKARLTGPAVPLTERVDQGYTYDATLDGRIVYVPRVGDGAGDEIVWLDRKGSIQPLTDMRATWAQPRLSPDGKRLLVRKTGPSCELWMIDLERGMPVPVVQGGDNHDGVWSPDGSRIVYEKLSSPPAMVTQIVVGPRAVTTIAAGQAPGTPQSWSRGGNLLVYTHTGRGTRGDIWVRAMDGVSAPVPVVATPFDERDPSISPDGRWIAYVSNETGNAEVFVRAYPDAGAAWQASSGGGGSPLWSRDGRELFFVSGTRLMSTNIETRSGFRIAPPVPLFDGHINTGRTRDFDVAADGRFVAIHRERAGSGQREIRLLMNWESEVRLPARAHKP